MSIHKLTAGSGYDYLTRQVAAQDATEKGAASLASYYAEKGESPGRWVGSGLAGLDGLAEGDVVTAEQMKALFGSGRHPLSEEMRARLQGPGLTAKDFDLISRLGVPYKVYANDVSAFRLEVAKRVAELNRQAGLPAATPGSIQDRARVRSEVASEFFHAEFGRAPRDAREIAATIAKHSRPKTTAVAGYDLTFRPVKSVSTLWALADPSMSAAIERAHDDAVKDALDFIESHALFTRTGTNGVRQVDVRGLIATAFTHRDSRAGDPLLHTHVAVANKVQTLDGRWLAIDGRVMFKATVAASETYNTAIERRLGDALGVRFAERPDPDTRKRPVREIVGVDPRVNALWSSRRVDIEARRKVLAATFQRDHGRPPTPIESIQLAQQATLETRAPKHEPRSLDDQRAQWLRQAREVLGGQPEVHAMLASVSGPVRASGVHVDAAWMAQTGTRILDAVQSRRAHWQSWHVRAEALRQVRGTDVPTEHVDRVVDMLVDEVLGGLSTPLTRSGDGINEPEVLRRADGSSVYTVAGSALFTSAAILAAEQRIVSRAGQSDGQAVSLHAVDLALLESAANGLALNAGQATLVSEMATSGARVQLAIAPAGAGKTTAMAALAAAWAEGGGTIVGLAPSAAAAAILGEQLRTATDTMAKLTWSIARNDLPAWAEGIGPRTLVVIDEAGMADTLSLDAVVEFVVARGASVRLVGDDQQLAAIGAGGVLRDIQANHGSLHLTELMRFTDQAEGAASLALRDGLPEALGFYLDRQRVHVGDLATMTDDVFSAWQADHAAGRDAIMLAPTRDLVSELNQRARAHRLDGRPAGPAVPLGDGNQASVGDLIITRSNDRRLRTSPTDWVKNGDRWSIVRLQPRGALTVQHARNGRLLHLPADYVATAVELGYASTIHTAQGLTADTGHTLLTGEESRQLAYTAATRGRMENHLYLEVVGDGDVHNVVRPDHVHPLTATDLLERILARDDSPRSATTMRREDDDPATLLGHATARYLDSLYVAAEQLLGPSGVAILDNQADRVVSDLTTAPAWPTLRAHLILLAVRGVDPLTQLRAAAGLREIDTAGDVAAVIDWRLDDTGLRSAGTGPLPWIPGVPEALFENGEWGPYLAARASRVRALAEDVREATLVASTPMWARQGQARPGDDLLGDVAVWRAAMQVDPADRRPTGATQLATAAGRWQRGLDVRFARDRSPALAEWSLLLDRVAPTTGKDAFAPYLAERLAAISRSGLDAHTMVRRTLAEGALPDDHAAAALWWRICGHLSPAVAAQVDADHALTTAWTPRLSELVGVERAAELQSSSWWPALVTSVDHALARGSAVEDLLTGAPTRDGDVDPCQALVWRISVLSDPPPHPDETEAWQELDSAPDDMWQGTPPPSDALTHEDWLTPLAEPPAEPDPFDENPVDIDPTEILEEDTDMSVAATLHWAARTREYAGPLDPSEREISTMLDRAYEADTAATSPRRISELNTQAQGYFSTHLHDAWAGSYLRDRLGTLLEDDPGIRPGYAPAGWTGLVTHLRGLGAGDQELSDAGLTTVARTGRLVDRFRDRVMFPIEHDGQILGFVGRRNPGLSDKDGAGPKYLNTADTALFHKGAQLYAIHPELLTVGATPVLVEGPMDALAVTLAGEGRYVGMAPLGTSLTEAQASQLAHLGTNPIVATDADLAGIVAAHRDYWLLTQHGLAPQTVTLPRGSDPASLLADHGTAAVRDALAAATPLAEKILRERLDGLTGHEALKEGVMAAAADDPTRWDTAADLIAQHVQVPVAAVRRNLAGAVRRWDTDPRAVTADQIGKLSEVRGRLAAQSARIAAERWIPLGQQLDERLVTQSDWPALAGLFEQADASGVDVSDLTHRLLIDAPLGEIPAQDLRYRLAAHLPVEDLHTDPTPPTRARSPQSSPQDPLISSRPQLRGPRL
ncbi:MAG TPA: MobF family relaxase [Dermatophilaceae bacterium]|jgi:DNA primase catalytic core